MKRGDKIPVTIAGQTVANAEVREVGDGQVTLIVPGTLVVMATRTEIAYEAPQPDTTGTETQITGVDRTSNEPVEAPAQSATVGETNDTNDTTQGQDTTPTPEVSTVAAAEVSDVAETTAGQSSPDVEDSGSTGETGGNSEAS